MQKVQVKLKLQILHSVSSDVEILNPDLVICNLDENTNFHMEMNVNTGKGYVPAEKINQKNHL
jgi:DNA-directed RNA polymerase alpha subunit